MSRRTRWVIVAIACAPLACGDQPCPEDVDGPVTRLDVSLQTCNHRPQASLRGPSGGSRGQVVVFDGSRSSDRGGDPLTGQWTLRVAPVGSAAQLQPRPDLTAALTPDVEGDYEIELVVSDGALESAPVTHAFSVVNHPPVADAGPDRSGLLGTPILLDGSNSSDLDGDPLSFTWTIAARPTGSSASLSGADQPQATLVPDVDGVYVVNLAVDDGRLRGPVDTVRVAGGIVTQPPVADAGADRSARVGSRVTFDGSASSDPDGDPLSYQWRILSAPSGSAARLDGADRVSTGLVPDVIGVYELELVVDDGFLSASDTVRLTANNQQTPSGSARIVDLPTNNLVTNPTRDTLYASVPSTSHVAGTANSVVEIDPSTGMITNAVHVGSEPGALAVSDDGRYLYVALLGAYSVRRVDLTTFTPDMEFVVPMSRWGDQRNAGQIVVMPGDPDTVVISTHRYEVSPSFDGVVVIEAGVPRPTETPGHTGPSLLVGGENNQLYGFNNLHTGFEFYVVDVGPTGASIASETRGLVDGFANDLVYDDGWVISYSGAAVDPTTLTRVGTFAATGPVAADATRVYYITGSAEDRELRAFDRATFTPVGDDSILLIFSSLTQNFGGYAGDLVRWGDRGLAYRTYDWSSSFSGQIYIFESEHVVR